MQKYLEICENKKKSIQKKVIVKYLNNTNLGIEHNKKIEYKQLDKASKQITELTN